MDHEYTDFLFLVVLIGAAWQDLWTRSISRRYLLAAGSLGALLCILQQRNLVEIMVSFGVGAGLLGIGRLTQGAIGEGDGWFFIVSGLYLNWRENMLLFFIGLGCCFVISLPLSVVAVIKRERNCMSLPFLPFLVPGGLGLMLEHIVPALR